MVFNIKNLLGFKNKKVILFPSFINSLIKLNNSENPKEKDLDKIEREHDCVWNNLFDNEIVLKLFNTWKIEETEINPD